MKKILTLLWTNFLIITPTITITACNNDPYLEITNDDIYDEPNSTGKIDKIAFIFMYALPENEQPENEINQFYSWHWNLNNRKKIIGTNHAGSTNIEYWKIIIQKTKEKGLFVSEYKKSYEPIKKRS